MAVYVLPDSWDAKKFAKRYVLDIRKDFYINADGNLVVFPVLPDDPPVFELSDPPQPSKEQRVDTKLLDLEARITALEGKV